MKRRDSGKRGKEKGREGEGEGRKGGQSGPPREHRVGTSQHGRGERQGTLRKELLELK